MLTMFYSTQNVPRREDAGCLNTKAGVEKRVKGEPHKRAKDPALETIFENVIHKYTRNTSVTAPPPPKKTKNKHE